MYTANSTLNILSITTPQDVHKSLSILAPTLKSLVLFVGNSFVKVGELFSVLLHLLCSTKCYLVRSSELLVNQL